MYGDAKLSNRAKHRLRIAARFLRIQGYRFTDGYFYRSVIYTLQKLNEESRGQIRDLVDWLEKYELSEIEHWGKSRSLPRPQTKTMTGNKRT